MVRNFDIDGADQHALSYIESSEAFLSFARTLFSQKVLIVKLEEKMQRFYAFLQLLSKTNASCMLPRTPLAVCRP